MTSSDNDDIDIDKCNNNDNVTQAAIIVALIMIMMNPRHCRQRLRKLEKRVWSSSYLNLDREPRMLARAPVSANAVHLSARGPRTYQNTGLKVPYFQHKSARMPFFTRIWGDGASAQATASKEEFPVKK